MRKEARDPWLEWPLSHSQLTFVVLVAFVGSAEDFQLCVLLSLGNLIFSIKFLLMVRAIVLSTCSKYLLASLIYNCKEIV